MNHLYLANSVSNAVFDDPPAEYVRRMHAGNPRKVWYARPGDVLIASAAPSAANLAHAMELRGIEGPPCPDVVVPTGTQPSLADRALGDPAVMEQLTRLCAARPLTLVPFVQDRAAHELARRLGIAVGTFPHGTPMRPEAAEITCAVTYELNDKETFRAFLRSHDLPTAQGVACAGRELATVTAAMLEKTPAVIIKRSRGSNGFGHLVVTRGVDIAEAVAPIAALGGDVRYVVEHYAAVRTIPSLEFVITDAGPRRYYACDMRCLNNSWVGMVIPALETPASTLEAMWRAGDVYARAVFQRGFRGVFDLDGVVAQDGEWFFTESNTRATGGTHSFRLLEELLSPENLRTHVAVINSIPLNGAVYAAAIEHARRDGYLFDRAGQTGVIFALDGSVTDGALRYIAVGKDYDDAKAIEARLQGSIRTDHWTDADSELFLRYDRVFNPAQHLEIEAIVGALGRFAGRERFDVMELGSGQGWLAKALLDHYPNARYLALDGSRLMLDRTLAVCAAHAERLRVKDFRLEEHNWREPPASQDAIVSALLIHHLDAPEKARLYQDLARVLRPGGMILVYDIVGFRSAEQQRWFASSYDQTLEQRARAMLSAPEADAAIHAFHASHWNFFKYPDDPVDKPSPVAFQLQALAEAGFEGVDVLFSIAGHALFIGFRPT